MIAFFSLAIIQLFDKSLQKTLWIGIVGSAVIFLIIWLAVGHTLSQIELFSPGRFEKNYNSYAYTAIINHKKMSANDTAFQNFTKNGPIAFLPLSSTETSVVYSLRTNKNTIDIKRLIEKFNPTYSIIKINDGVRFELKSSSPRKYYKGNILAFGDLIHKIHPLAGQGFNMSLRDIKLLSKLIDERINIGLDLDGSLCREFQKKAQDKKKLKAL